MSLYFRSISNSWFPGFLRYAITYCQRNVAEFLFVGVMCIQKMQ